MGNRTSKHSKRKQKHRVPLNIGGPQDIQIHIPRNRADEHGQPIQQVTRDIDRNTLLAALNHVSRYIANRNQKITVVAVGGAVNTLYLQSRCTTHDVDIFGSDFSNQAQVLLDEAMHDAQQHFPGLGTDWLNTETQMWMPGPLHRELTADAQKQNIRIFDDAGLVIYAAPWTYAFTAKINRIIAGGDQSRSYDLADAITYLHQYIRGRQNRPVPVSQVLQWSRHYNHQVSEEFLRRNVNMEYRRLFGVDAVV
ncbi:hypothetical protein SPI_06065 [Niveomyces insectorum RCEF 264]|uniref:DUF7582 domain-containing protein n=1 Tax=Niveomyces insectorum RCEF 264 TaxID=1081102 RepID=A0A167SRN9_9HYPO|nr:hypothetical protein SPI_06065 [Niveomyces insectorum RCEF 264]